MNYKIVFNTLGKVLVILALVMCVPMVVGLIYHDGSLLSFLVTIGLSLSIGLPLSLMKLGDKSLHAKEGFVIVALCWITMSLMGALPFIISGSIPNFFDAFFETVSGFTTTGSSILSLDETGTLLPKGIMFWRIFTHWLGGMGVLVFVLAILPSTGESMYIMRAEAPGPSSSKLVSKISHTARILYGIYVILTFVETILLLFNGMGLYEAFLVSCSTAGTGGLGIYGSSIAHYDSAYVEMVVAIFMFLFGINFNLFYLIVIGKIAKAIKSEEFISYVIIVLTATLIIAINVTNFFGSFWVALRHAFFQTASISSTTGFSTVNFIEWPALSKGVLMTLMIIGACGGSTGGGIKVSRLIILGKSCTNGIKKSLHPRSINSIKLDGESLSKEIERNTLVYFILWVMIVAIGTLLLCLDVNAGQDIFTNFTATLTCIGNVGPGMASVIGPLGNFAAYNGFSKILLSIIMLAGRLEILPMLILFAPNTWKRGK